MVMFLLLDCRMKGLLAAVVLTVLLGVLLPAVVDGQLGRKEGKSRTNIN